jgi:hypothetical protein
MDKISQLFSVPYRESVRPSSDRTGIGPHLTVHIADKRISQLLLVLQELDESVAGLEGLDESKLSELISVAIRGCGFTDPVDAWHAVAAVLEAIERDDSPPECS